MKSQITNHKSQINQNAQDSKVLNFDNWRLIGAWNFEFGNLLLISFLLAVMYMTNAWDGIIYFILASFVLLYINLKKSVGKKINIFSWLIQAFILGIIFIAFSFPFNHYFKPFVSGIGVVCPPQFFINKESLGPFLFEKNTCLRSPIWQLFILYGFFYFWVISFLVFLFPKLKKRDFNFSLSDVFILLIAALSTILIIIPEFIYVKDIYPTYYRANTMFKLVYQTFIMLSIVSGYAIVRLIAIIKNQILKDNFKNKILSSIYLFFSLSLIVLVMIYPIFAISSYYNNLKVNYGLNGIRYLGNLYTTDHQAILWLNENIKGQPVILEAQGDSYTDYARVSANTGLPTVLGWTVHEWLWRGTYDIPAPRITEVKTLYETSDINTAKKLIEKYKIAYVFLGDLEYQKYPNLVEQKFQKMGRAIYQNGRTKIYKITSQAL